uniref:Proteasome family protein n=1 Tax=Solanum tuberosum TaxID=4113 RepID=M1DKG7_SOLTU
MGLFLKISNIMKKTKGSAKESFKFLIQYLGTFLDEDASAINEKKEALYAIIAFVKAPDMFQLDMPAIGQLEKDAKHALAYHEIDDIEVESWVVKAISAMLLSCKIDQMNQVITVRYAFCGSRPLLSLPLLWLYKFSSEHVFGKNQWQLLRAKLVTWKGNISGIISTIYANKIVEDSTRTMQGLVIR